MIQIVTVAFILALALTPGFSAEKKVLIISQKATQNRAVWGTWMDLIMMVLIPEGILVSMLTRIFHETSLF